MPARILTATRSLKRRTEQPLQTVVYARVSSKDQEKEGFSIQAQLRLLREYAANRSLVIVHEFVDVETAKASGRTHFNEMLLYLEKHRLECRMVLVEKTDRLYRNLKDWTALDDLGTTIHLVKEGRILGPDSGSSDHLVHGFNVLLARNYVLNLGEETRKGMLEKARSGVYPSCAPVGYRNAEGPNGKRIIIPDPQTAPIITELFERFATGEHSLDGFVAQARAEGMTLRGPRIHKSLIHQILRKRLYMGEFNWDGIVYRGTHEPLVSRECWEKVQELLDARAENRTRKVKHDFAYTGLVRCGHCGCLFVGELKKGQYLYYHCTGNRGKCPEPYTRQETLTGQFAQVLQELVIPQPILDWLVGVVLESDQTERAARDQAIKRLRTRYEQLQTRIETMYLDKLNGRIRQEFYDKQADTWRHEQNAILRRIQEIPNTAPAPVDEAIDALRLTTRACEMFLQQPSPQRRRLLQVLVKTANWRDGALRTTLFEPFEILRHSNQESSTKEREKTGSGQDLGIWLRK